MKTLNYKIFSISFCLTALLLYSCTEKFLEENPIGQLSGPVLANKTGVNGLLIGAYSMLDGLGGNVSTAAERAVSNWSFGSVGADDAHKGSQPGDQSAIDEMENYTLTPLNGFLPGKWNALYTGAQSANEVIRLLDKVKDGSLTDQEKLEIKAEAVFLRSVFLFEAAKIWKNVPYVDENISFENNNFNVPNDVPILPKLEEDLKFAAANLNAVQPSVGRANSWAAKALLGKVYLFDHKYTEAKEVLTDVINNGVTSLGVKYALVNFADNFNPSKQNNAETVFSVQASVQDGAKGANGNTGDALNFPVGGPATCCGFFQPSFSLVNSYKTDPVTGLPLLDSWNNSDIKNDMGIDPSAPFTPYAGTLDPRLDWTVGRRGIPLLDFGIMPGSSWIRLQSYGGPYVAIKNIYYKSAQATTSETWNGWAPNQATSNNYNYIRFADVLLLAAEAEAELGNMDKAQEYVNRIRARAAKPEGFVHTYIDNNDPLKGFTNTPAANYFIGLYPAGAFGAMGKEYALKAIRFERKIELAMEGHRFFDLRRWDEENKGYMAKVLNDYIAHETTTYNYPILKGARFTQGKNELYPIPQNEIDVSTQSGAPTLKQNPGY